MFRHYAFLVSVPIAVIGTQNILSLTPTQSKIQWKSCGDHSSHHFECGRLSVPMDYAQPEIGRVSLSIMRLLADPRKRKGSIYTNPGGPGVEGTGEYLRRRAPDMLEQVGGEYDIVSWDIRGVNATTPKVTCFDNQEAADEFWSGSLWYEGVETNSSLRSAFDLDLFYSKVPAEDARLRALWDRCNSMSGNYLPYVGTASNARDLAAMVDAIDGVGSEINYWGFSYGSILGQYLLVLFPERSGRVSVSRNHHLDECADVPAKVILDGVVHAPHWGAEPAVDIYNKLLIDTDKTYIGFAEECAKAGPKGCALASPNSTKSSVLAGIEELIFSLYDPSYSALPEYVSRSSSVKTEIFLSLQIPREAWQQLAKYLRSQIDLLESTDAIGRVALLEGVQVSRDELYKRFERHEAKRFWSSRFYNNYWSIVCSDAPNYDGTTTRSLFDTIVEARNRSELFGPMWPTEGAWPCHQWPVRAVERVQDFRVKPKHPVLILSNVKDPVTSIENAYEMLNESFNEGDAGLGIREGYGHCSYSMKSSCIDGMIQDYLRNWTLPARNTLPCPTEEVLFPTV